MVTLKRMRSIAFWGEESAPAPGGGLISSKRDRLRSRRCGSEVRWRVYVPLTRSNGPGDKSCCSWSG